MSMDDTKSFGSYRLFSMVFVVMMIHGSLLLLRHLLQSKEPVLPHLNSFCHITHRSVFCASVKQICELSHIRKYFQLCTILITSIPLAYVLTTNHRHFLKVGKRKFAFSVRLGFYVGTLATWVTFMNLVSDGASI